MIKELFHNKKAGLIVVFLVIVGLIITVGVMNVATKVEQEKRAFDELKNMIDQEAAAFSYIIELQYAPLETIANGLGLNTNLMLDDLRAILRDFVKNNHISELGYADLDGNTISCFGEDLGNIAHRKYFTEIVEKGQDRAIEFLETTSFSDEPKIMLSVPMKKDGELIGIIFIAKERDVFTQAFPKKGIDGAVGYVIDSEGNFIIQNQIAQTHFKGDNFFTGMQDEHLVDIDKEDILRTLNDRESGSFTTLHSNNKEELVVYSALESNDWVLFCMVDKETIISKTLTHQDIYTEAIVRVLVICALFILYIMYMTQKYTKALREEQEQTRFQMERANSLFDEMKSVVYDFDVRKQEFDVTDAFENTFGFALKKQLMDNPKETMRMKYEYDEFLEGIETVVKTGKKIFVNGSIVDKETGTKWMKISMNPFFSDDNEVVSIYGVMSDVTETVEQENYLREKAELDEHTLLPNKSCCERILQNEKKILQPTGCIMFDLNGLKQVNDTLGHIAGDNMIKDFADILKSNVREGDFVGRFGGDEFIVVLNHADKRAIKSFMGRLSHKTETFNNHNSEYKLSYSAGWAFTIGGGKSTLKELLDIADSNMYDAKRQHKENL